MNITKTIALITGVLAVIAVGWIGVSLYYERKGIENISNFEECAANGFPVMESYPRQCRAGNKTFKEEVSVIFEDKVKITEPLMNAVIKSPLKIAGEARGLWFFEAGFPVKLLDANGKEIAVGHVEAKSDWMTQNFVPFEAVIDFPAAETKTGVLVIVRDNPSGLPANAEEFKIPVVFTDVVEVSDAGIEGVVTIGPTCPVEKNPPDPNCADKPYKADLEVSTKAGKLVKRFSSGVDGKFKVSLPAGEYVVNNDSSSSILPRMAPVSVVVKSGQFTKINIGFDSGIR
jgi:hypothetical protein